MVVLNSKSKKFAKLFTNKFTFILGNKIRLFNEKIKAKINTLSKRCVSKRTANIETSHVMTLLIDLMVYDQDVLLLVKMKNMSLMGVLWTNLKCITFKSGRCPTDLHDGPCLPARTSQT